MDIENLEIPKNKIKQLKSKGMDTIEQLAKYFPRKYLDFRSPLPVSQVVDGQITSCVIKITSMYSNYSKALLRVQSVDEYGNLLFLVWFNCSHMERSLKVGSTYIVCGKVSISYEYNQIQMLNPMYISEDIEKFKKIIPSYSQIKGMSSEYLLNCIEKSLKLLADQEYLEDSILNKFKLMNESDAIFTIHNPENLESILNAKRRFVFDTLFQHQFQLEKINKQSSINTEIEINEFNQYNNFLKSLPFGLTKDQKEAMEILTTKIKAKKKINALLTADVGAGKTIIAFLLMVMLAENGYQSVLMAPTSVLAKQHFNELVERLKNTPFKVCFLSGNLKVRERNKVLKGIENGEYHMIIGTHAVIQKDVVFKKLGIAIIDEEHRFGVAQRRAIIDKCNNIHYITISATPIPRSLALTVYGDNVDVITIGTMPSGRKKIKTCLAKDKVKSYQFMQQQILKGHQCYFVCPLIEKSNSEIMEDVDAVEDVYKEMLMFYKNEDIKIVMVTGKMKGPEVDEAINLFKDNKAQIMVATTVIEVGVNVPNATVITINNAERFGLAQLHQLRGRVGRSDIQSYCMLISQKDNERLNVITNTNDGFTIAQQDLKLRGSGDLLGEEQSGQSEFIDFAINYPNMFRNIKKEIKEIYKTDQRYAFYEAKI